MEAEGGDLEEAAEVEEAEEEGEACSVGEVGAKEPSLPSDQLKGLTSEQYSKQKE
mgnify:CR=1 FL=1